MAKIPPLRVGGDRVYSQPKVYFGVILENQFECSFLSGGMNNLRI